LFVADSTMLAYILSRLNCRHNYGLDPFLLYVDECTIGYRDDSLRLSKGMKFRQLRLAFAFLFDLECEFPGSDLLFC